MYAFWWSIFGRVLLWCVYQRMSHCGCEDWMMWSRRSQLCARQVLSSSEWYCVSIDYCCMQLLLAGWSDWVVLVVDCCLGYNKENINWYTDRNANFTSWLTLDRTQLLSAGKHMHSSKHLVAAVSMSIGYARDKSKASVSIWYDYMSCMSCARAGIAKFAWRISTRRWSSLFFQPYASCSAAS